MNSHQMKLRHLGIAPIFALMSLTACGPAKPTTTAPQSPAVSVVTVHRSSVPIATALSGRTSPYLVAEIRARVDGIVLAREFKEGTEVTVGQRLYQIDPAPYVAALNSAKASLEKAKANVVAIAAQAERMKHLLESNAISQQEYDNAVAAKGQAVADVDAAKAAVASAEINVGYTNVVSPIAGRSGVSQVTQGAYVQANAATLMATVQQIDPIYVDLTQSSVEGLQVRRDVATGQLKLDGAEKATVSLSLEDGSQYPLRGTLELADITVDPGTGTVVLRAIFPNPHSVLLPGMFVHATIDEGDENAMLLPEVGVTHDPTGQATTMVVGPDNRVEVRPLKVRGTTGQQWIVEDGLQDGDRVIVAGIQNVHPGDSVQASEAPGTVATAAPPTAKAITSPSSLRSPASAHTIAL
jgi:membrane fusion protein (multidrug efflux system)